jgi:hypothetical protein
MMNGIGTGIMPPVAPFAELVLALGRLAVDEAQRGARRRKDAGRPRKGAMLRPGDETPLWNAVVERVRPQLNKRGAKANLARVLGVPRQRVHDYFVARTQMPDAERMIHVLVWLVAREADGDHPVAIKSPKPLS